MKPAFVIYGNCQAAILARAFERVQEAGLFSEEFEVAYFNRSVDPLPEVLARSEISERVSVLLLQVSEHKEREVLLSSVPQSCRIIRFPYLHCSSIWPLYCKDPRQEERSEWGATRTMDAQPVYGDRLALRLLNSGLTPQQAYIRYMAADLLKEVNLDRIYELDVQGYDALEKMSDIPVKQLFLRCFQNARLFWAPNHVSDLGLTYLFREISGIVQSFGLMTSSDVYLGGSEGQSHIQIPIHPQVIEHFQLKWVDYKYRYHYYYLGKMTFPEYMMRYLEWK